MQTVTQAATSATISSSANPSAYGQSVTFPASVTPAFAGTPTGTVTFFDGSTSLGSATLTAGSAQISTSTLSAGSHSITAVYNGDTNFTSSTSSAILETVNAAPTATSVASSANPSSFDQAVTFTAVVQSPAGTTATGTVTFLDGSTSLGTAPLSSNSAQLAVSALSVGTHSVTAVYAGNANLSGSTSAALSQVVNGATTTTTATSSPNPSNFAQSVTLSATIQLAFGGSATGTVTFFDGATSLGSASVSANAAQLSLATLTAGAHSITAKYNGDANFSANTSATITQTVNQGSTATTVVSNLNPSAFAQSVTFTASVQSSAGGSPTGTVTFFDGGSSLGSVNLSGASAQLTVSSLSVGSHSITAKYSGDSSFAASTSGSLTETVNKAASSTTLGTSANPSSYGQSVTFTAAVAPAFGGTPTGTVTFFDGSTSLGNATLSGGVATLTTASTSLLAGSHSISAKYSGDSNFLASTSSTLAQIVNPAATSATLTSSANPSAVGKSVTFTAHVSSSVGGTLSGISSGSAQFSTNSLTAGFHTLTAVFVSSNSNFGGSTSAPLTQAITDFTISASPASKTITRGTSGAYTITITPRGGLTGTVSLACSGLPGGTTCAISPSTVTLDSTNPSQATVTITVAHNAGTGTHTLTFKGTSGGVTHSTSVTLQIN